MSDLDDDDLVRRLGAASGPLPDVNLAFAAVTRRVVRARRRRVVSVTAGAATLMVAVAAGVALRSTSDGERSLVPSATLETSEPVITTLSSTTSTTSPIPALTSVPTSSPPSSAPTTAPVSTTPATTTPPPGTAPTSPPTTLATATPATTTTAPTPTTSPAPTTVSSIGGTVTVSVRDGALVLSTTAPAPGFSATVTRSDPDRIEIDLASADHVSSIRIELDDGTITSRVDEDDVSG